MNGNTTRGPGRIAAVALSAVLAAAAGTTATAAEAGTAGRADRLAWRDDPMTDTLVGDLAIPWGIAFLPSGAALVTERSTARLLRVGRRGEVRQVATISEARPLFESGLLGVAVSPMFLVDHYVFLFYTSASDNRIVRYRYSPTRGLRGGRVIVQGIPKGNSTHLGGKLAFGPDGYLYASTGDATHTELPQNRDSLAGKILRMTKSGRPAPGNPFGSLVWSYGHRNVEGLTWDPAGRLYATEFGSSKFDEINRIHRGGNYGWPVVEGVANDPRFIDPLVTWTPDEASPAGVAYAKGALWVAALRGKRLWHVPIKPGGGLDTPHTHFVEKYGRLRAVARTPDNRLWVGTSNKDGRAVPGPGDDRILQVTVP
ncbi:PQQ-dependent sugar dehydrogenase [Nonomuraea sp. NBC_01738]|uniref:PQQ-dependent sugar dehydrogenase n=1 Tax=Nonomuraea sp. NBC_01738 TaxID=2976003 RepID=UPI002E120D3F|nr:PQQ-dependent sugar dehydrogenase [Nonomuraea sp. NBC_01738]